MILNKMKFMLMLTIISISGISTSQAYTATPEQARELQKLFQEAIDEQEKTSPDLIISGKVKVTPIASYYNVKMPHIRIGTEAGNIIDIGIIVANMAPSKKEGLWKIVTAIPTPIKLLDFDGVVIGKIDIGSQKSATLWHKKLNNIVKADIKYKDIVITDIKNNSFNAKIEEIIALYDLEDDGNDIWSGPADIFINNISVSGKNEFKLTLDKLYMKTTTDKLNPKAISKFNEQISAISESSIYDNRAQSNYDSSNDEAVLNMIIDYMSNAANGYTVKFGIDNLDVSGMSRSGPEHITIDNAEFGTNMNDIKKGIIKWGIALKYTNLFIKNAPESAKDLYPTNLNLDFTLNKFPLKGLLKSIREASAMAGGGADPQLVGMGIMMALPRLLTEARSSFDINNSYISSDNYDLKINGTIKPDMKSKNFAKGDIIAEASGLDKLQKILQKKAADPNNAGSNSFQEANMMLGMAKSLGKREDDPLSGEPYWTYHLQTQPNGSLHLNGGPVGAMFGQ